MLCLLILVIIRLSFYLSLLHMASQLTEVARISRKIIKFSAYGFVGAIILSSIIFPIIKIIYKQLNPPEPYLLSTSRTKLPQINFPEIVEYKHNFTIQTPDNKLPTFPDRARVFYIYEKPKGFAAEAKAKEMAAIFKFEGEPTVAGNGLDYVWQQRLPALLEFSYNIKSASFKMAYQWQSTELGISSFSTKENLVSKANSFLQLTKEDLSDIDLINAHLTYLKASGNSLKKAVSFSDSDFVRLDFFKQNISYSNKDLYYYQDQDYQKKIKEAAYSFPIYANKIDESNISLTFSGSNNLSSINRGLVDYKFFQSNISYLASGYQDKSTYYLKPVSVAFDELIQGKAYVANKALENTAEVPIRRVYLAYYDSAIYQQYLQPIYIFSENDITSTEILQSDNIGFVAYVPAIRSDQINIQF